MIKYTDYPDRKTWLENRYKSLGASEIAIACEMSRFKSRSDLWERKNRQAASRRYYRKRKSSLRNGSGAVFESVVCLKARERV